MGVAAKEFEGGAFIEPGSYGTFKAAPQPQGESIDLFTQIIIGKADNGNYCLDTNLPEIERVIIGDYDYVKSVVGSGEIMDALVLASSPGKDKDGNEYSGPRLFKLFNVCNNATAQKTLVSTDPATSHTLKAIHPGPLGNKLRIRKNLTDKTIEIGDSKGVQGSNKLERAIFTITYLGDGTACSLTISGTQLITTVTAATDGSASFTVEFSAIQSIGELVDYINAQSGYTASLQDAPEFLCTNLDAILAGDAVSIKTLKTIYADLYQEERFLLGSGYVKLIPGAIRKPLANMTVFAYLAGGTTGAISGTAFKEAIEFAKKFSGMYRNILSSSLSDAVQAKVSGYDMVSPKGANETITSSGAGLSDTLADRMATAKTLGSWWCMYGVEKFYALNHKGVKTLFPGYMLSVLDNAISASVSPRISPTYKALNIIGSAEVLAQSDREKIIQAGGLCLKEKKSGVWCINRSVTTESKTSEILNNKASVQCSLAMVKEMREDFNDRFIGENPVDKNSKVQGVTEADVRGFVERKLQSFVERGYLVGSEILKKLPYDPNFKITIDGNAWSIRMKGNVMATIDFMFYVLELDTLRG